MLFSWTNRVLVGGIVVSPLLVMESIAANVVSVKQKRTNPLYAQTYSGFRRQSKHMISMFAALHNSS